MQQRQTSPGLQPPRSNRLPQVIHLLPRSLLPRSLLRRSQLPILRHLHRTSSRAPRRRLNLSSSRVGLLLTHRNDVLRQSQERIATTRYPLLSFYTEYRY